MPMADGYIVPYNLTTVSQQFNGGMSADDRTVNLQHFVFSIAVQNLSTDKSVTLHISKYTNDSVIIPPNSYKEIAVTTDWYKVEFEGGSDADDKVVIDRIETEDPDFLMTPLFPNLYQSKTWTLENADDEIINTEESTTTFFVVTKNTEEDVDYSFKTTSSAVATTGTLTLQSTSFSNTLYSFKILENGPVTVSVSGPVYNPINSGGYTYTPWSTSDGSTSVLGAESVVKVDYYLNGNKTSSSSGNFYTDFANTIFDTVYNLYPPGYDPVENPQYDPTQFADVVSKLRTFFDSIKATSIHDQYIGGWARMSTYNKDLSLYSFTLDRTGTNPSSIEFPFTALGFTIQRIAGGSVDYRFVDANDVTYSTDPSSGEEDLGAPLTSDDPVIITNSMKRFEVLTSNAKVKITFSGNLLKLIDFAPIINIVYPLGFDETSGKPLTEYQSYTNALTAFDQQLTNNKFTGRVVYFKSIPFGVKEPADVWNADYIIPEYMPPAFKLVFPDIQEDVYNWYARSNMESDLLKVIAWENKDIYYEDGNPEPASLLDVISNVDVHTILGQIVTGADNDEKATFKRNVIKKFLLNEYNGPYSMGGLNFFRFGFTV